MHFMYLLPMFYYVWSVLASWAPTGFLPGVGKLVVWGQKSPSGVHGWIPGAGLGAKHPEADDR